MQTQLSPTTGRSELCVSKRSEFQLNLLVRTAFRLSTFAIAGPFTKILSQYRPAFCIHQGGC